ncbi:MAG: hypothetical protein KDB21_16560 [Acidimicrobiales bacterium]|nr:hypothetical protein [Acidimicrobiales bacterium]
MSDREQRRRALQALAGATRDLNEAVVRTAVPADVIDELTGTVHAIVDRLRADEHPGPYSGLSDRSQFTRPDDPQRLLPLSPACGPFNPTSPELHLAFADGGVEGTVRLGRRHVGPPESAHGGVIALICDQLVAVAGVAAGLAGVTRDLQIGFRRPVPLDVELTVGAHCVVLPGGDRGEARGWIDHGGVRCVETSAQIRTARRVTHRDPSDPDAEVPPR